MKTNEWTRGLSTALLAVAVAIAVGATGAAAGRASTAETATGGGTTMKHARGTFEVKITPQPLAGPAEDELLGRMAIEKEWKGDLEAIGKGQMLTAMTAEKGSAGYVAVERVAGALDGRRGTFALLHRGVMTRGEPDLLITVVPDSGTGELAGLTGSLAITIVDGRHDYDLEYTLPAVP